MYIERLDDIVYKYKNTYHGTLSNYETNADLNGATGVDTSYLAVKSDLASLKTEVDKIDIDKLKIVSADLSKLSNLVDNDVVKNILYDKLVTKVNKIENFNKKIPYVILVGWLRNITTLASIVALNTKFTEIECKKPDVANLATKVALNTKPIETEIKMPRTQQVNIKKF